MIRSLAIAGDFQVRLAAPPPIQPDAQAIVDATWDRVRREEDPHLHDGPILCVLSHSHDAVIAAPLTYRSFLAESRGSVRLWERPLRVLAVSAAVECQGDVLVGKRSEWTSQFPCAWELVPSGALETEDFRRQLLQELAEEACIAPQNVTTLRPLALIEDEENHLLDIAIYVEISPTGRAEVPDRTSEYSALCFIPEIDLQTFLTDGERSVVPTSLTLAALL